MTQSRPLWVVHRENAGSVQPEVQRRFTERRRAESRTDSRQAELERAARINQLGEMAAGLAHEINQPLAAIIYTLTGAANRARTGALNNAQMLEAVQAAIAHGHRAANIVSRIRSLAAKHAPCKFPVQLNRVMAEIVELSSSTASRRGVRLRCEPAPDLPVVLADQVQIEQVLLNLIMNGIDASAAARWREREVAVSAAPAQGGAVEVSVTDTGEGMPSSVLARMFHPFFTTKENGMGLGLSICRSIVEEHGGTIRAENLRGSGARVYFTLPVKGE